MSPAAAPAPMTKPRRPWAGFLLGFALSGFFDGILLHQILQWHHLLLGIRSGPFGQLRTQILADGLFHALMYGIALAGLWSLWRNRERAGTYPAKALLADALIGFGVWHVLDAVVSHWVLGIHRIRMDSPNPLFWDLLWLGVFGLVPLAIGVMLRRRPEYRGSPMSGRASAVSILVGAVIAAGLLAARPPVNVQQVAVIVRPGEINRLLDGLPSVDGRILWADRSGVLWVFSVGEGADTSRLYGHGALFVTRSPAALGCVAWVRVVRS